MTSSPFFDVDRRALAVVEPLALADAQDLAAARLLLGGVGRTMPLLVLLSASTRLTRILSPNGRSLAIVYAPSHELGDRGLSTAAERVKNPIPVRALFFYAGPPGHRLA
jgi:hypothetical protein